MNIHKAYELELQERKVRQKRLDEIVKSAMDRVATAIAVRRPPVDSHFWYGSSAIHPRHLVTWYLFRTDADWAQAQRNGLVAEIEWLTRRELVAGGYSPAGAEQMMVSFTSEEDIQRKTGGDHYLYFK